MIYLSLYISRVATYLVKYLHLFDSVARVLRYVVVATKSVHRSKIRPIVESTPSILPSYIRVRAVVWKCGEEQTDTQTDARDQYTFRFVYTTHRKCNYLTHKNTTLERDNLTQ